MLNQYVWDLYLKSGGSEVVEMFRRNLGDELSEEFAQEIVRLQKSYCVMEDIAEENGEQIRNLIAYYVSESKNDHENSNGEKALETLYEEMLTDLGSPEAAFSSFSEGICEYSTDLAITFPNRFIPYYYRLNFNMLQKIADTFDIELPKMPIKQDYKGRLFYYSAISKAFLSFMEENNLSHYELYAFLYDFAPKYIGGKDAYIIKDLPNPGAAYFIGSDRNDPFLEYYNKGITIWQCNPDTRAGDMVVMYLRTPVSAVRSIGRACSVGFIDPFFFYYRGVFISHSVDIKPFALGKMRKDRFFKDLPIVRKNMQGVNGVELHPSVYNHLVENSKVDVPLLENFETAKNGAFRNEKAVEKELIRPLIQKLGYGDNDYRQQMYVEIGNHNKALIPDFVLLPNERRGFASGFAIIEAKRSITRTKELKEALTQARSYARQLTTTYCVVASMEKIWVTHVKDNFDAIVFESSWDELRNADTFYELKKLIGK